MELVLACHDSDMYYRNCIQSYSGKQKKKLKQNTDIGKVVEEDSGFFIRSGNDGIGYLGGTKVF